MSQGSDTVSIAELRKRVRGEVIGPDDAGYDTARALFYAGFDRRPAAVVRVADGSDVQRVVVFARDRGVDLAVRSGGHSIAGQSVNDGGVMIDLGGMRGLDIDVDDRTAWAETGLTGREYSTLAATNGLVTGFGDTGSVGIGGITLGGGVGYLVRAHGLTIDDLLAADVVTADGELRRVDEESEPDLFWAIRGGGGNFGVATRFRLRLHEHSKVFGGMLMLPATTETVEGFLRAAREAPEELSTIANIMPAPPMPFVPEDQHGRLVIFGLVCFAGDPARGEAAMEPFRSLAAPIVDMLRPLPYPELYPPDDDTYHPTAAGRTLFTDDVDAASIETILGRLESWDSPMRATQIRVLGGAMARVPNDATAFAHRDRAFMVNVAALFADPADRPRHTEWVESFAAELRRGPSGCYVNFLDDEGPDRVREAYPGSTWDRLREIKTTYDPTNLFHGNQNIPPLGARER
ncbi:MAG: FAD-binding oxidoreductase [Actinomycetota bacterium]